MRNFSAILLISLFAFSQYARQLSYLECKFSNTFKTDAFKCDCDKKSGLAKPGSNQSPVQKIHTHIHPDEFFSAAGSVSIGSPSNFLKQTCNQLHIADDCKGNYGKPWRPPDA